MGVDRVIALGNSSGTVQGTQSYRIAAIGPHRGSECARVHAASFEAGWDPAEFDRFLAAGETIAHGSSDPADDRIVGIVLSRVAADEAEILTLAVAPQHRRRGLARRLFATHLESLVVAGASRLFLEVDTGNLAARALYASIGFARVGERKAYYRSAGACPSAALVMCLDMPAHETGG